MRIIVEGPRGYPRDESVKIAKKITEILRDNIPNTAIINIDEPQEPLAFSGPIWTVESRMEYDD